MHGPWCITGEEERDRLRGFSLFTILLNHQLCIECLFYISHLDIGEEKVYFIWEDIHSQGESAR